jgi:hypothetical protein
VPGAQDPEPVWAPPKLFLGPSAGHYLLGPLSLNYETGSECPSSCPGAWGGGDLENKERTHVSAFCELQTPLQMKWLLA